MPQGLRVLFKVCLFFLISLIMSWTSLSYSKTLLEFSIYGSDPWARYTLKSVCWCIEGEVGSKFSMEGKGLGGKLNGRKFNMGSEWGTWWRGLPSDTGTRRKLCMVPYHSCQIYWTCRNIDLGEILISSNGGKQQRPGTIF